MYQTRIVVLTIAFLLLSSSMLAEDHLLSEKIALSNDRIIKKGQTTPILKPLAWLTSRTIGLTLFPACSAIDIAILTTKQASEIPFIIKNDKQHIERFKENHSKISKCCLGMIATPASALSSDLVTHHFIPSKSKNFEVAPYGKLYRCKAYVYYPESIAEVQSIIQEASASGKKVSLLGAGMSQGKQAISNSDLNIAIDTKKLNWVSIDPVSKTANVGAGATWESIQQQANKFGLAVKVMQASNIFTVGGSLSVNCHGWDHKCGNLRNTILSIKVIDACGEMREFYPNDKEFNYIVGGFGLCGAIVEAKIMLTENHPVYEYGIEIEPECYVDYFKKHIRENDEVLMHLYRLSLKPNKLFKTGVAVSYLKASDEIMVSELKEEPKDGTRRDRIFLHTLRRLPWLRSFAWNLEKKNCLTEKFSTRNEVMRPPIKPIFNQSKIDTEWLQEFFVKEEHLSDFLEYLSKILESNRVAVLNASVRFVKHDPDTLLSYSKDGDRFAVVLFFNQKLSQKEIEKTKLWVREVIDYLIANEGTYYLPYQHFATLEQFQTCYPGWKDFLSFKKKSDPTCLFETGFFKDYLDHSEPLNSPFRLVFSRGANQRRDVRDFINNIFMQLNDKKFINQVDSELENPLLNDEELYTHLFNNIKQSKDNFIINLKQTLKSLNAFKDEIGEQTAHLVGEKKLNGYLEIGYPGRMIRPLKRRLNLKGPFYVLNDKENFSDYLEAGFPLPYDKFINLNNYSPIAEEDIPSSSIDLVCMYIGLHHAPKEKLEPFLASIYRILRPGGSFILMDHDAHSDEIIHLADVVHSIFNCATGVDPELNRTEIRNFHSLHYWMALVRTQGFEIYEHPPLIRKGDPTLNALVRFDKPVPSEKSIFIDEDKTRDLTKTYLTAPEWQNVRASQRYAKFVETDKSYQFPYFSEIGSFWTVFGKSFKEAMKNAPTKDVLLAENNLMNLFIGTTMTIEYGVKGLVSLPFKIVSNNSKPDRNNELEQERLRSLKNYGKYIENTPFYEYPFFKDIGSYWNTYWNQKKKPLSTIKGAIKGAGITLDYALKGIVSAPMALVYGSNNFKEDDTIHCIFHDPNKVFINYEDIHQKENNKDIYLVEMPRYMRFKDIILDLSKYSDLVCINIAGQTKIQLDVRTSQDLEEACDFKILYNIPAPSEKDTKQYAIEVETQNLLSVIRKLNTQGNEILFIHDY